VEKDSWEAFSVAGLLVEWFEACELLGRATREEQVKQGGGDLVDKKAGPLYNAMRLVAMSSDNIAELFVLLGPAGAIVGSVLSVGIAIHGWTQRNFSQKQVWAKMEELRKRIQFFQCWLAKVDSLVCPICCEAISDRDATRSCSDYLHCYHAGCFENLQQDSGAQAIVCPACTGPMDAQTSCLAEDAKRAAHAEKAPDVASRRKVSMRERLRSMAAHDSMLAARRGFAGPPEVSAHAVAWEVQTEHGWVPLDAQTSEKVTWAEASGEVFELSTEGHLYAFVGHSGCMQRIDKGTGESCALRCCATPLAGAEPEAAARPSTRSTSGSSSSLPKPNLSVVRKYVALGLSGMKASVAEAGRGQVIWEVQTDEGWIPLDPKVSERVTWAEQSGEVFEFSAMGHRYCVFGVPGQMQQVNCATDVSRPLRRRVATRGTLPAALPAEELTGDPEPGPLVAAPAAPSTIAEPGPVASGPAPGVRDRVARFGASSLAALQKHVPSKQPGT